MIESVEIVEAEGARRLDGSRFPLALGGNEAEIDLPGFGEGKPVAWIGLTDGEPFLQTTETDEPVLCNGSPVATSQWIHDSDVIRIASTRITVRIGEELRLEVEEIAEDEVTAPPMIVVEETTQAAGSAVQPIEFTPKQVESRARRRRPLRPLRFLVWGFLALLLAAAGLLFSLKSVRVEIEPEPDRVSFRDSAFGWKVAGRHVLRPGSYTLVAEKEGFRRLEVPLDVTGAVDQTVRFTLTMLPGSLTVASGLVEGASVFIDGAQVGATPTGPLELEPGEHVVRVEADSYDPFETAVTIEGGGRNQSLVAELVPRWAAITFTSHPAGARVSVAGKAIGETPVTTDLLAGAQSYALSLAGYKTHRSTVIVEANESQTLPTVTLRPADAKLLLRTEPEQASVTVGEDYRGRTPVELRLAPSRTHRIRLTKSGHDPATREVRLEPGATEAMTVVLAQREGEVEIVAVPESAELFVNGEPRGPANQVLTLVAMPHQIELRKEGYEPYGVTVTPRPGFPQTIHVTLKSAEQLKAEAMPESIRSPQGQRLVLIRGGRFRTGAPRREPGRRANEVVREIELTRPFYLSTTEVTNEEFHEFRDRHRSGRAGPHNLEIGHHPVVRVSWEEAARYCNWLSGQDSLPPVYVDSGGRVVAADPLSTGYRLPTEAEWVWAARHAGEGDGQTPLKYPWGQALPVPPDSGNYADRTAADLVSTTIEGYDDHFPATAPVDSFRPNPLGLFNMGGNVAEWAHDVYTASGAGGGKVELDPVGPSDGATHVIRGSSWMDATISELRLSYRDSGGRPRPDLGFRIARYAE